MNFVALLAVLAASSFTLPLLVQGGEALGLGRGPSIAGSLVLALAFGLLLAARARRGAQLRGRVAAAHPRRARAVRRAGGSPAAANPATTPPPTGLPDAQAQARTTALRMIDAEEESRAGL